jgi:hypothetical protein
MVNITSTGMFSCDFMTLQVLIFISIYRITIFSHFLQWTGTNTMPGFMNVRSDLTPVMMMCFILCTALVT